MSMNRNYLSIWIVLGCMVFAAAGMQLVGNAWGGASPPAATTAQPSVIDPLVRGQSPEEIAAETEVVEFEDDSLSHVHELILYLAIFMLAIFVGFEVITKVPPTLHTPLMSGSNAISGITLVGAIIVSGAGWGLSSVIGMLAVVLAMINVAGGFLVTHRMLSMFQSKKKEA